MLVAVSACTGQQQFAASPGAPQGGGGQLVGQVLRDIGDFYIEPVSIRRVALAGAGRLSRLDKRLAVGEFPGNGDTLSLSYDDRTLGLYPAPKDNDVAAWSGWLDTVISTAIGASPQLAGVSRESIEQAVFAGMTRSLDHYSRYASPELAHNQRAKRDGWGGIGVTVDGAKDVFRVTAVTPQGPADRAGIRPEDQIVAIDGIATHGCVHREVVERLVGPIGSAVNVKVLAAGTAQARELKLRRDRVFEPTVTASRDGDIAVLRVNSFNHRTTQRVAEALADVQRHNGGRLSGIVLDLRSNPGGVLDQAVTLADLFLSGGPIVSVVGRHPASRQYFQASGRGDAPQVPIVVLINGGSASASEIVAAALQDTGRGVVIGSSSYGKGTVQTVLRLANDGELILTWARLIAPSGYLLQQHGVIPTVCTADLPDDERGLAVGFQRAAAAPAARSRAALDEVAWADLHRACPKTRGRPAIDLALAKALIGDAGLYGAALRALPAYTRTAETAAAPRTLP